MTPPIETAVIDQLAMALRAMLQAYDVPRQCCNEAHDALEVYEQMKKVPLAPAFAGPLFKAAVDTRHFEFEAYGRTEAEAQDALRAGLTRHSKQYALADNWVDECMGDFSVVPFELGSCLRDREPIGAQS